MLGLGRKTGLVVKAGRKSVARTAMIFNFSYSKATFIYTNYSLHMQVKLRTNTQRGEDKSTIRHSTLAMRSYLEIY